MVWHTWSVIMLSVWFRFIFVVLYNDSVISLDSFYRCYSIFVYVQNKTATSLSGHLKKCPDMTLLVLLGFALAPFLLFFLISYYNKALRKDKSITVLQKMDYMITNINIFVLFSIFILVLANSSELSCILEQLLTPECESYHV